MEDDGGAMSDMSASLEPAKEGGSGTPQKKERKPRADKGKKRGPYKSRKSAGESSSGVPTPKPASKPASAPRSRASATTNSIQHIPPPQMLATHGSLMRWGPDMVRDFTGVLVEAGLDALRCGMLLHRIHELYGPDGHPKEFRQLRQEGIVYTRLLGSLAQQTLDPQVLQALPVIENHVTMAARLTGIETSSPGFPFMLQRVAATILQPDNPPRVNVWPAPEVIQLARVRQSEGVQQAWWNTTCDDLVLEQASHLGIGDGSCLVLLARLRRVLLAPHANADKTGVSAKALPWCVPVVRELMGACAELSLDPLRSGFLVHRIHEFFAGEQVLLPFPRSRDLELQSRLGPPPPTAQHAHPRTSDGAAASSGGAPLALPAPSQGGAAGGRQDVPSSFVPPVGEEDGESAAKRHRTSDGRDHGGRPGEGSAPNGQRMMQGQRPAASGSGTYPGAPYASSYNQPSPASFALFSSYTYPQSTMHGGDEGEVESVGM
eukprot:tig00021432_g21253.t1